MNHKLWGSLCNYDDQCLLGACGIEFDVSFELSGYVYVKIILLFVSLLDFQLFKALEDRYCYSIGSQRLTDESCLTDSIYYIY
jgi:hypothetical protein